MIISRGRLMRHCISPSYWGNDFAAYRDAAGGLILARVSDGASLYFQPGDSSDELESDLDRACKGAERFGYEEADAIDNVASRFDEESFISSGEAGGAPSSDGGFYGFFDGGGL